MGRGRRAWRPAPWPELNLGSLQVVVAWGTEQVSLGGEVVALSKVHADFDVQTFRVSLLDETR